MICKGWLAARESFKQQQDRVRASPGGRLTWVEQVQFVLQDIHQPSSQSVCEWHRCHAEEEKQHA